MAKPKKRVADENIKILDVDANMQGTMTFHDPVNLRINGDFEGRLDTKGSLSIGEQATVRADLTGDVILVAGKVFGNIVASQSLSVISPGKIKGDIRTPSLSVTEGAVINGSVDMSKGALTDKTDLTLKEVAQFLEVEMHVLEEWAQKKKIPAQFRNNEWTFERSEVERWVHEEKVKM